MKTRILFEDEELLVVYKPAGIATQAAGFMQADVVSELKNYFIKNAVRKGAASKEAKEPYLGLVHRLDQPVEGVLVFAKTSVAAAALSRQITEQTLKKEYLAAVYLPEEKPGQNEIVLTDYLIKDGKTNVSRVASKGEKKAKKAVLSYYVQKVLETEDGERIALLRIKLQTGRHHQIRVQLSNAGMPLLGDRKYGTETSQKISDRLGIKDVALCAESLVFKHPKTGKVCKFTVSPQKEILQNLTV